MPGYYTDGFTVAAPQLGDVAEYAQTVFASRYKTRYGSEPKSGSSSLVRGRAAHLPGALQRRASPARIEQGGPASHSRLAWRSSMARIRRRRESPGLSISTKTTTPSAASPSGFSMKDS